MTFRDRGMPERGWTGMLWRLYIYRGAGGREHPVRIPRSISATVRVGLNARRCCGLASRAVITNIHIIKYTRPPLSQTADGRASRVARCYDNIITSVSTPIVARHSRSCSVGKIQICPSLWIRIFGFRNPKFTINPDFLNCYLLYSLINFF